LNCPVRGAKQLMAMNDKVKEALKIVEDQRNELLSILERTRESQIETANERLARWKTRTVRLISENIHHNEGVKLQNITRNWASAVKLASELNIDNRIMYTIGAAAKKIGLMDSDVIFSIPLSTTGKSPYFDR
jgi:hypothetical protein